MVVVVAAAVVTAARSPSAITLAQGGWAVITGLTGPGAAAPDKAASATRAARGGPRDDQYVYTDSQVAFLVKESARGDPPDTWRKKWWQPLCRRQIWESVDGSKPGRLAEGSLPTDLGTNPRPYLRSPTYKLLTRLPTDPTELLAAIRAEVNASGDIPQAESYGSNGDMLAFQTIRGLLSEQLLPSKLGAAIYQAARMIPGVTTVPDATDAVDRHGVALELADNRTRTQLIFDKATQAYLGQRDADAKTGELQWITAQLNQAVVDHAGQTPN